MPASSRRPEGIVIRHARSCVSWAGERCDCRPGYQAQVFSPTDGKTIRKTFRTLTDARAWRSEAQSALRRGTMRAPTRTTLNEAAAEWLSGANQGVIRTRSGEPYKPSALRAYEQALRTKLLPTLGTLRLSTVTRASVQDLVDRLVADGLSPSTVRNAILPLRAIYRRAISRSEVLANPTLGLSLPAVRSRRERVADPTEAKALLASLPAEQRPLWATALYAGLRRGELKGLRWCDVDFDGGVIRVERGWDDHEGPIAPKSRAGRRSVPMAAPLRAFLAEQRLRSRGGEEALVFGEGSDQAVSTEALAISARGAWKERGLEPIGLHECRHTYAAFMIAAGVNAKALSTYLGHSSITMTLDRYGHLMPGNEGEAATMLGDYLARAAAGSGVRFDQQV